jgi:hypothetical protein
MQLGAPSISARPKADADDADSADYSKLHVLREEPEFLAKP